MGLGRGHSQSPRSQPASQPASQSVSQSASQLVSHLVSHLFSQPSSQPARQSLSQPASFGPFERPYVICYLHAPNHEIWHKRCLNSHLVGLFSFTGAGIFHVLEGPTKREHGANEEIDHKAPLEKMRVNLRVNMTGEEFVNLVNKLHEYYQDHHERSSSYEWTFYASLYFSASVVTTIVRYLLRQRMTISHSTQEIDSNCTGLNNE